MTGRSMGRFGSRAAVPKTPTDRLATLRYPPTCRTAANRRQGLIASLARPGGNITGFTFIDFPLIGKWLEMLREIAPGVRRVTLMFNPQTSSGAGVTRRGAFGNTGARRG